SRFPLKLPNTSVFAARRQPSGGVPGRMPGTSPSSALAQAAPCLRFSEAKVGSGGPPDLVMSESPGGPWKPDLLAWARLVRPGVLVLNELVDERLVVVLRHDREAESGCRHAPLGDLGGRHAERLALLGRRLVVAVQGKADDRARGGRRDRRQRDMRPRGAACH